MIVLRADVAEKYAIPLDRLKRYEERGLLTPIGADDFVVYEGELRVSVIAKAEQLGFNFEEIVMLILHGTSRKR